MRYNQYSYTKTPLEKMLTELSSIGFHLNPSHTAKENLYDFLTTAFTFNHNLHLFSDWIADKETDLTSFFASEQELTEETFYFVAFQLLGFLPFIDFDDSLDFHKQLDFPITYGNLIENLYHLLNTRTKDGNILIDQLVSEGFLPEDNDYHYFNGKSLATFSTHDSIREVVYVESRVDTDKDGLPDLIKVCIIRPRYDGKIPAVMTASPYHQGINDKASDKALHNMNVNLEKKEPYRVQVTEPHFDTIESDQPAKLVTEAREKLGHIGTMTLNDYLQARGFANLYVSGVGTRDSQGMMTSGDYQQIEGFKNVIDWLNGRCRAFTDQSRQEEIKADWSNGKVATTGISYLGTMSNGLATTGVDGLEVIIAEAGISSWYNYYRENGLVTSPGGYPGEDFDSLTALTYSRAFRPAQVIKQDENYLRHLDKQTQDLDRKRGDYNQFWHDRNYLPNAHKVKAEVVFTHGTQDWNVKPLHVYKMFNALPNTIKKHLFLHNGAHVYMNNWQSIDFRESMNALLSKKLLGYQSDYQLPAVIWQDNSQEQHWITLDTFGHDKTLHFPLGNEEKIIENRYDEADYDRYAKSYTTFMQDLFTDKAKQASLDFTLEEDLFLNGSIRLNLRLKSSTDKGLISAQLLDYGQAKRLAPIPRPVTRKTMDNGRYFYQEDQCELPLLTSPYRVVTKGYLNLQNRHDLLEIETVPANEWLDFSFDLQPSIYKMKKGDTLRLVLYTTDFEITVRDKEDYHLTLDLANSSLDIPNVVE